jgi:hypothetical protein
VKIPIEDLLPHSNWQGWIYQAAGVGNSGAEGTHFYYGSETAEGSLKTAPSAGQFSFSVDVDERGPYSILLRTARGPNSPGDARNDIWIRLDGHTRSVTPDGPAELTSGGNGFVKFKGATTKWSNAHQFSTETHDDINPASTVLLDEGVHTITFAPRSTGFHIDSVQVVRIGDLPKSTGSGAGGTDGTATEIALGPDPHVTVFLGHDGYRHADDNLAMLVGTAQALKSAAGNAGINLAGLIYGDVKDAVSIIC